MIIDNGFITDIHYELGTAYIMYSSTNHTPCLFNMYIGIFTVDQLYPLPGKVIGQGKGYYPIPTELLHLAHHQLSAAEDNGSFN